MKKTAIGLILLALSGCATTSSLDDTRTNAPHRLMSATYSYPFDDVYRAAKLAILDLGLALESEDKQSGSIYARSTANMAKVFWFGTGYGETVGIYLTPMSDKTRADVAIQKTYKLDMGYKDYRGNLLGLIQTHLDADH
jgi:uncharacterized protein YceK